MIWGERDDTREEAISDGDDRSVFGRCPLSWVMFRGLSLAAKCLVVFGGAIILIVTAAMTVPWLRMIGLIDAGQLEVSRQMVSTWERLAPGEQETARPTWFVPSMSGGESEERGGIEARRLGLQRAAELARTDPFLERAISVFSDDPDREELQDAHWTGTSREYRYVKAERRGLNGQRDLAGLVLLQRRSIEATRLIVINTSYVLSTGAVVLAFAMLVFYVITRTLVLSPVKELERAAERVRAGNLNYRAELNTGDEFQQLAETLNRMLSDMQVSQERLRAMNGALDMKLHELAATNSELFQSAKLKGEFLANVSHELRTPLNSIIGFAELLMEAATADAGRPETTEGAAASAKRVRYLDNILTAGRNLLAMINSLLEMAKIEAGRVDLALERMSLHDTCRGLLGLIFPLAQKRGIELKLEVSEDLPLVVTDSKKFQQIIFNFLSNAVKFTEPVERSGRTPQIVLRAERLVSSEPGAAPHYRVSVIDNGRGISPEDQGRIFEKFVQADAGHTREHAGTGLGLAICKELATLLHGEIQVVSEVGRGSMFSVIIPAEITGPAARESQLESKFRGTLTGRREWAGV